MSWECAGNAASSPGIGGDPGPAEHHAERHALLTDWTQQQALEGGDGKEFRHTPSSPWRGALRLPAILVAFACVLLITGGFAINVGSLNSVAAPHNDVAVPDAPSFHDGPLNNEAPPHDDALSNGSSDGKTPVIDVAPPLAAPSHASEHDGDHVRRVPDYTLDPQWNIQAPPSRREFNWNIKDHVHNPDGVYRPMILVNNQFPGPLIEANEGDTIVVHVHNEGINATAIHWHGLYQHGTPYMDGTVGVTQCKSEFMRGKGSLESESIVLTVHPGPIPPGGNFTYEFRLQGQSGTYWWHGHYGVQGSDGLHGPLVIHSRNESELQRLEYASDRVIMLSDHYHDLSSALLWQYLKSDMENVEPMPDSGLVNGHNVLNCDTFPERKCDNTSSGLQIPTFEFERGQKHRIRLINVGAFAEFEFQIDDHEIFVSEVDGTAVEPISFHRVTLQPAQRYSVIVNASNPDIDSFWLRARMLETCFKERSKTLETDIRAVVRYSSSATALATDAPASIDWEEQTQFKCRDLNVSQLAPVEVVSPPAPDAFFYVRANFEIGAYRLSRGFFNTSSWRPDIRSPSLFRAIDGIASSNTSFTSAPQNTSAFTNDIAFSTPKELIIQTTGIQTIDILIHNFDDGTHPLHLHGYKFFILAHGHAYPPLTSPGAPITQDNLKPLYDSIDFSNPLRRDTASVEGYGWMFLRVVADNPGMWAFHCHVSWHAEAGLLMQFLTRSDELARMSVPEEALALCGAEGIEKGRGPEDEAFYGVKG